MARYQVSKSVLRNQVVTLFRHLPVQSGDPEHAISVARDTEDAEVVDKDEVVAETTEDFEVVVKVEVLAVTS